MGEWVSGSMGEWVDWVRVVLWTWFASVKVLTCGGIEPGLVAQHPTSLPIAPTFIGEMLI